MKQPTPGKHFSDVARTALAAGRNQRQLHCILWFRILLELQEHQHDCTPNDLLAAYAALALRPLATPRSAGFARGCVFCVPGFYTQSTLEQPSQLNRIDMLAIRPARMWCIALDIYMLQTLKETWFSNIRGDVLAGIVVALALIPEAIAFSIIAGVDPKVGLYASFCICAVIAFVGGRPGMISAATGAMALLMVTLVKDHGLQYLLAATLLCGVLQILAGYLKLGSLMRFVSRSVVTGFVNALAILIFMAQLPELTNVTWHVYAMTLAGLGIIYLFPYVPKIGKLIPSPLVCILTLTAIAIYLGLPEFIE